MGFTASELEYDPREFVARVLTDLEGQKGIAVISMPAPFAPLSVFLRSLPRAYSVMWDAQTLGGTSMATSGIVRQVALTGVDRFQQLKVALPYLWREVRTIEHPDCEPLPPVRVFGGVSFVPGSGGKPPWTEFTDGRFILPRWTFGRTRSAMGFLRLAVDGERDCSLAGRHQLLEHLDDIIQALEAYEGQTTTVTHLTMPRIEPSALQQMPHDDWVQYVNLIRSEIRSRRFHKIVAARRSEVRLDGPVDDIEALSRLATEPQCTRFAFRGPHTSFIGASPETLVRKRGLDLSTQALAGTLRSLGSELPILSQRTSQLMQSKKDQSEHEFVVSEIIRSLQPFVSEADVPEHPTVSKIRNILHLNTPITAKMKRDANVLDVVDTLHPTPAVGGMPKREAAAWIADNELHPRGWYTGTVGWVDSAGDATFVVAIRCGLLTPHNAYVFAGAGIVGGSDPTAEYGETELKQLPMLRALGMVLA
jgi:isochorismate synthase